MDICKRLGLDIDKMALEIVQKDLELKKSNKFSSPKKTSLLIVQTSIKKAELTPGKSQLFTPKILKASKTIEEGLNLKQCEYQDRLIENLI